VVEVEHLEAATGDFYPEPEGHRRCPGHSTEYPLRTVKNLRDTQAGSPHL
jgi:hypothetical protein